MRDLVPGVDPDLSCRRGRGRARSAFPARRRAADAGAYGRYSAPARDQPNRSVPGLHDRGAADVEPTNCASPASSAAGRWRRVRDDLHLHVEPLPREEALRLRVEDACAAGSIGSVDDRDGSPAARPDAPAAGRRRPRAAASSDEEAAQAAAARDRVMRSFAPARGNQCVHLVPELEEPVQLRVAVCDRGRGSPTSIAPTTAPRRRRRGRGRGRRGRRASSMSCVTWTIVTRAVLRAPWTREQDVLQLGSRRARRPTRTARRAGAARAATTSARAIATRCCMPPDSCHGYLRRRREAELGERRLGARAIALRPRQPVRRAAGTSRSRSRSATGRASGCSPGTRARPRRGGRSTRPPVEEHRRPRSARSARRGSGAASSCRTPDGPTTASSSPSATSNETSASAGAPARPVALRQARRPGARRRSAAELTDRSVVPREGVPLDDEEEPVQDVAEQAEEEDAGVHLRHRRTATAGRGCSARGRPARRRTR